MSVSYEMFLVITVWASSNNPEPGKVDVLSIDTFFKVCEISVVLAEADMVKPNYVG